MPRFFKEYGYWIVIGAVIIAVLAVQWLVVAPRQARIQKGLNQIKQQKTQLGELRQREVYNPNFVTAFDPVIAMANAQRDLVQKYMQTQRRDFLDDWPEDAAENKTPERALQWGAKFIDGSSTFVDRVNYRIRYPQTVVDLYNEHILPLLPPADRVPADSLNQTTGLGSFMSAQNWDTSEPTNEEIVTANTMMNVVAAFADVLIDAKKDVPGLYEYVDTFDVTLQGKGGSQGRGRGGARGGGPMERRDDYGGMRPGDPGGRMGPDEYGLPDAYDGGGPPDPRGGMDRRPDPSKVNLARGQTKDKLPPGRIAYSDARNKKYIFDFQLHAVMDWRKLPVLIGKMVEAPGLDMYVERVTWRRAPGGGDVPLVDVDMTGTFSIRWEPPKAAPAADKKT